MVSLFSVCVLMLVISSYLTYQVYLIRRVCTCVHVCARVVMLVIAYVPFSVCVLMLVISCECTRHTFTSYPPKKMKEKENKKRLVTLAKPLPTSAPP